MCNLYFNGFLVLKFIFNSQLGVMDGRTNEGNIYELMGPS